MDDLDKNIPPTQREHISSGMDDATMPGKRARKPDGRFAVGDLIMNRYKILAELGQGGMGVVYRCLDEIAGIEVALKALPPELSRNTLEMEDIKDNFQLVHNLHHPNIASSNNLERDDSNGNYYLIMEFVDGEDLRRWIKRKRKEGSLTLDDVLPIIQQVADALDYAHEQKIIHRDIKPGNIMIDVRGKIKVLDFGLAAQIHTSMTRVSMAYHGTSGTGPYMAPEQWRGRAQGAPADQYALAVMTYEMLAGHLPFESSDAAVLRQAVLDENPEEITDIPQTSRDAVKRAMSKEPGERFASCSDFAAALGGKKIKAAQKQTKGSFPKWAAGLAAAALLGAGGTGYYFFDQHQKEQARQEQLAIEKVEKERLAKIAEKKRLAIEKAEKEHLAKIAEENRLAREKAEKERLAKIAEKKRLAREKAEKERLAKIAEEKRLAEEKRKDELQQENYRLQPQVKIKKARIDSARYDRGQTFGKYLDILAYNFAAAERAELNKDPFAANKFYKTADKAADWIIENAPLRANVQALQKQVKARKAEADRFTAARLAFVTYKAAGQQVLSAKKNYFSGNFRSAITALGSAISGYEKALTESRRLTLKNLIDSAKLAQSSKQWDKVKEFAGKIRPLDSAKANELITFADEQIKLEKLNKELSAARSAKSEKNWQSVHDHAVAALKIDSSSTAAQELKQEAENNLPPTLEIIATVDGSRVPAKVKFSGTELDTMSTIRNLTENGNYKGTLTYQTGDKEYTGEVTFTSDWRGLRKINVALTKVVFNGIVDLPNGVKLQMVKIKAGTFTMGSPEHEEGRDKDEKQHKVVLTKDFWLGKFEVTQAQYRAVAGNNPSYFKGDHRPVEKVSWYAAKSFCNRLNELYANKLPRGYKFDLPTEAQWEYACRAGTATSLYNGKDMRIISMYNTPDLDAIGWYGGNCGQNFYFSDGYDISSWGGQYSDARGGPHNVGALAPNAWGLYDMIGNVCEWCSDWYGPYNGNSIDPEGPSSGKFRVCRGGGWQTYAKICRSGSRFGRTPEGYSFDTGFRLALVPVQ